jgi:ribonuclease HI
MFLLANIYGNAVKSFFSEQEARDFAAGRATSGASSASKPQGDKFYGVAVGRVPGVYEDWNDAAEQIKDVKGPKYKKFATRAEAEEFVRTGGKTSIKVTVREPTPKKVKRSVDSSSKEKTVTVYTDGSSRGNGKVGAIAGVGVYFGDNDPR